MVIKEIHVEIYSRPDCHLCDDAKAVIERIGSRYRISVTVTNIDESAELRARYGSEIPVIFINGSEAFRHRVDGAELERKLRQL